MANTRIGNDSCRIIKHNEQSTGPGRWVSNVPGPGTDIPFMEDPHIRVQYWAGNTWTNTVELQDKSMRGMSQTPRDCITKTKKTIPTNSHPLSFSKSNKLTVEQMRAICPAWTLKGLETDTWIEPLAPPIVINPFAPRVDGRNLSKKEWSEHNTNRCPWEHDVGLRK